MPLRHWQLVMLAFTFSLLSAPPSDHAQETPREDRKAAGENPRRRIVWQDTLRQVRGWLSPWARLQLYWHRWSTAPPPPELAALLDHVGHSHPLVAPT
ncbi:hypothetical protein MXD63_34970 [Frankia sp. Cpl3]|nr:hypothetical protein [Frankia sp. Cpl3]